MPNNEPIEAFGFPVTLAFAADGTAYFSERMNGCLWEARLEFDDHDKAKSPDARLVMRFPIAPVVGHHETGLLGIALDPDFESTGYIYCYYTHGTSKDDFKNRVIRIKKDGTDFKILLDDIPAAMIHNGGIIAFGPDQKLYIGTGVDNPIMDKAQDVSFLGGKILRINRDGSLPDDNPIPGSPVYAYGLRNVFGLAFHPTTGKLYASDVGPDRDDEINVIEPGGNYGWPIAVGKSNDARFINPLISYTPVITPVQSVFVGNDLYFASYNEGTVHKLALNAAGDAVESDTVVYKGEPFRLIGVFYGPDEKFYATMDNQIIRFEPESAS